MSQSSAKAASESKAASLAGGVSRVNKARPAGRGPPPPTRRIRPCMSISTSIVCSMVQPSQSSSSQERILHTPALGIQLWFKTTPAAFLRKSGFQPSAFKSARIGLLFVLWRLGT
ncbi:hypothetical protein THIX_30282 [Thiomonas sp. X19]|nr:hypothetical protein THIX_30282 [Thiomonas sp. X19]